MNKYFILFYLLLASVSFGFSQEKPTIWYEAPVGKYQMWVRPLDFSSDWEYCGSNWDERRIDFIPYACLSDNPDEPREIMMIQNYRCPWGDKVCYRNLGSIYLNTACLGVQNYEGYECPCPFLLDSFTYGYWGECPNE